MEMTKKNLIIFFIFIGVFFALRTNAQIQSGDIVLEINPKYPKANEEVRATLSTFTIDLNNTRISWVLNGETMLEGIGKKNFSFKVGDTSFPTNLEVKIETINGSVINKKITISPSNVDLLWEAYDTYVPPFYKGKALVPIEGNIKVVAIPGTQNPAGFNYKWTQDYKNKPASSGYEKSSFVYKNSYLEDKNTVEATVSDFFGNNIGMGRITISPTSPKIVFYKKDPILGTRWESALSDWFTVNKEGETIVAEPYFFSKKDLTSPIYGFDWFINGEKVLIPGQRNSLSVKPEGNNSGNSLIKVMIKNNKTLFQSMDKKINVKF
jgi:hypothetical protein